MSILLPLSKGEIRNIESKEGLCAEARKLLSKPFSSIRRSVLVAVVCPPLGLGGMAAAPAFAQTQPQGDIVPPSITMQSPTGVDIATAASTYKKVDLTIGSLSLERFYRYTGGLASAKQDPDTMFYGPHWSNNFDIFVGISVYTPKTNSQADPQPNQPTDIVHIGDNATGKYIQNDWNSDVNVSPDSTDADAGILSYSYSGGYYTYADGGDNVYQFNSGVTVAGAISAQTWQPHTQRVASITSPNGYVKTFTYNSSGQLINVTDNKGYAIVFDYNSSGQVADACGFDLSSTYVTSATTCSGAALKVSYNYTNGELTSVVDVMGQTETYGWYASSGQQPDYVNCITPPGFTACKVSYAYGGTYQGNTYALVQTFSDGSTWAFASSSQSAAISSNAGWTAHNGDNPASVTDPAGNKTSYLFTGTTPETMTDPQGHVTTYTFTGNPDWNVTVQSPPLQNGTLLSTVTMPEGNEYLQNVFGSYNTVTQRTLQAKPGSSLANIVENITYNCPGGVLTGSCTKPLTIKDALNNETDYTYESFGDVQTVMKPAPSSGASRPLTVYTYVQQSAYVLNSSGSLVASPTSIEMPSTVTQCQTVAGGSNSTPTCDPSGPQEVTTYQYGPSGTGRNLLLRGEAVTANGVTLRTCYAYDAESNQISKTTPRAGLTTCP